MPRRVILFTVLLLPILTGCSLDALRKPRPPRLSGNPERIEFAPSLGVELSQMTRTTSGLYWRDLAPGEGEPAQVGQWVETHYTGWLPDGTLFDRNPGGGPGFRFPVGGGHVIRGWDEGVQGMRPGGRRLLVVPPSLAYGETSFGRIPPNATLVFEIELVSVEPAPLAPSSEE